MPEGFTKVLAKSEVPEGTRKLAQLGGKRVVVANVGGNFFAVVSLHPHGRAALEGKAQRVCDHLSVARVQV